VSRHAELAESVELAMLVVLESLTPLQRAVFVLREAFDLPFADIAQVIGRDEAATRQLASRARAEVAARRPRFDPDPRGRREITEQFLNACLTGDIDGLARLLATDIVLTSDGGGKAKAPRHPITGAIKVSRFLMAISPEAGAPGFMASIGRPPAVTLEYQVMEVHAAPAIVLTADGRPIVVVSVLVADGLIRKILFMANPDKLTGMFHRSEAVKPETDGHKREPPRARRADLPGRGCHKRRP
jgi:RNA polymerase sigma-70 factor (ECF subfamily)